MEKLATWNTSQICFIRARVTAVKVHRHDIYMLIDNSHLLIGLSLVQKCSFIRQTPNAMPFRLIYVPFFPHPVTFIPFPRRSCDYSLRLHDFLRLRKAQPLRNSNCDCLLLPLRLSSRRISTANHGHNRHQRSTICRARLLHLRCCLRWSSVGYND